eukprot:1146070-Pelagomonas_calceolata.AAC.12
MLGEVRWALIRFSSQFWMPGRAVNMQMDGESGEQINTLVGWTGALSDPPASIQHWKRPRKFTAVLKRDCSLASVCTTPRVLCCSGAGRYLTAQNSYRDFSMHFDPGLLCCSGAG